MLFTDNFVHGDLHPGNIFVTRDGELALLDAGIALRYTEARADIAPEESPPGDPAACAPGSA